MLNLKLLAPALLVIVVFTGCNKSKPDAGKPTQSPNAALSESTPLPSADVTLTAEDLAKDYTDVATGDMKFKGKKLRVTGKVDKVTEDSLGVTLVKLKGNDKLEISCGIPASSVAKAKTLKPDQSVTIQGECRGSFEGMVSLNYCEIGEVTK